MKYDLLVALALFAATEYLLLTNNLGFLSVWFVGLTVITSYGLKLPWTVGVLVGFVTVIVVALMGKSYILERFDNQSASEDALENKKKDPEPHSDDPHLDAGTTLLHAYRKLDPEQVVQMRNDTQELMSTQKELIETLAGLGPQVRQGAELIDTFKKTFGGMSPMST